MHYQVGLCCVVKHLYVIQVCVDPHSVLEIQLVDLIVQVYPVEHHWLLFEGLLLIAEAPLQPALREEVMRGLEGIGLLLDEPA